jgi:hypothetical protein
MAAIGATSTFGDGNQRVYNEKAAQDIIQCELDLIAKFLPMLPMSNNWCRRDLIHF